jgi:pimeloyl-ACP methyl ester carboxylesterase
MGPIETQFLTARSGAKLAFRTAGERSFPALVLLHGFPASSGSFRNVIGPLSKAAYIIAPDLPGFGESEPLEETSFAAFADCIEDLLEHLRIDRRVIYLHDFGAPVGLHLAMRAPELVAGLIIQNGNAHETGLGEAWGPTRAFWSAPDAENEAAATAHLSLEGMRDQYTAGVPDDIVAQIDPRRWIEDWRVMNLPGRMDQQRALIRDYINHVSRFPEIHRYLRQRQPPALLLWGRHDAFFAIEEVTSWMETLPRMEAHILDAGHFLLETQAEAASALISAFLRRVQKPPRRGDPRP